MNTTPPNDSTVLQEEARRAYETEEYALAAERYTLAADSLRKNKDNVTAAEMANNAAVAWLQAKHADKALACLQGTPEIFGSANDKRRQAMAFGNTGTALEELKRLPEALECFENSSTIFKEIGEKDMRAEVLRRISSLQVRTGKRLDAIVSMQAALQSKTKLSLKDHILKGLFNILFKLLRSGGNPISY
ncbi:MAG TPA: hypothetical protein VN376_09090 [Longilinea sp.]|nr:hypothetical protein [Longilinea sp.]